jgi:kynurenine formamidase
MGVVYLAEQEQPVRRRIALKIIKPGVDSAQVIARFESERQALALMDHPHIAKVLGAGKWGLECVANLSKLPPAGATVFVGAPKVIGASGGPTRVLAVWG